MTREKRRSLTGDSLLIPTMGVLVQYEYILNYKCIYVAPVFMVYSLAFAVGIDIDYSILRRSVWSK